MRCTSSPTSACTASAPIAPAARTSIGRGATATPESPSPARSTRAPGRRRRSARRPGRDHRQRRPDGRGRVPHRDAAAPPSAPRRLPGAGVRQERKRQRELTDRLRPLTERREQLRLPGPVRPPHRCDHTAPASRGSTSTSTSTAAGWCGQTTPRAPPAWVPKLSTTTSPGPRARGFRIWRGPATRPWLDVAATALISSAAQLPSRTVA